MSRNFPHVAWIVVHATVVAAYLAWRSYSEFDAVIIGVNLVCVLMHLVAMAAGDPAEEERR